MKIINKHQEIIEKLYNFYKRNGYVTEDSVFEEIAEHNLSLDEVDYVCDLLLSMGVIFQDISEDVFEDDEEAYDRSKIDYEKIFQDVIAIDESLTPFINEVRQIKPPQHREWQNLMLQAKNGNTFARQRILEMYIRVVINIALSYHKKLKIPLAETIQDGGLGLVIALDKFEVERSDKFSNYAPWWIRQNILRNAPTLNPLLYTPVHVKDKLFSIYDLLERCNWTQCDCKKYCSEILMGISERIGCNENEAEEYLNYLKKFESIEDLLVNSQGVFTDNCALEEYMIEDLCKNELKNIISQVMQTFPHREQRVILLRFGFIDEKEWTLEEVGKEYGVTRERIRQIEKKALDKIRRSKQLNLFFEKD